MIGNGRVLVLGGYGTFGERVCLGLTRIAQLTRVYVAGRDLGKAEAACVRLVDPRCLPLALDAHAAELCATLKQLGIEIVIHTCGPFQGRGYQVARAALAAGAHYLDLADARDFVCGIVVLDADARAAGKLALSGASTVPALSFAALRVLTAELSEVQHIAMGVTPGNRAPRGLATVAGVLSYVGQPLKVWQNREWQTQHGWQLLRRHDYPAPVGKRWLSLCDVPDLSLLPEQFPALQSAEFRAGLELSVLHLGLSLAAGLRRCGLVPNWAPHARWLKYLSECLLRFGSDSGAMHVEVTGVDRAGQMSKRRWTLLAQGGDGPQIPATAAVVLVRKLCSGQLTGSGAGPCIDYFSLAEFNAELAHLAIHDRTETL